MGTSSVSARGGSILRPPVVTVVGARPQFVKAAAISWRLRRHATEFLIHTGQHYDPELSEVFFRELRLPAPDAHLGVGSAPRASQVLQMLEGLAPLLARLEPRWVVVYGDTNSTLAGALGAAKLGIPLAHVEAGLRSGDEDMPEEANRAVADRLASMRLCPTEAAMENLAREGLAGGSHRVGDVMCDVLRAHEDEARARFAEWRRQGLTPGGYGLVTLHRASNTDRSERLAAFAAALERLEHDVVFPVHPRTRTALERMGRWESLARAPRLRLIKPLGYLDFIALLAHARWIATDSGGAQKEAYLLRVPCLTLRDRTEWLETVQDGWNRLLGPDPAALPEAIAALEAPATWHPRYGAGDAAERIVAHLLA
jgi:UDP-N-acetylglucosamine 2-epimerase